MRKLSGLLWMSVISIGLLAGSALAAGADEENKAGMDRAQAPGEPGDGMGMGHMGRMKKKLGLSDDQSAKLKSLMKKQMEESRLLRDQIRIDIDVLRQKVDSKAPDADIKKILDDISRDQKKMASSRKDLEDQLKSFLTPTQQAKLLLQMRGMGMKMMGRGMDRGKGHGMKGKGSYSSEAAGDPHQEM